MDNNSNSGFCPYCGRQVFPGEKFCPGCGAAREVKKERELNIGQLVFGLINIFLLGDLLFGGLAIAFVFMAKYASSDKEEKNKLASARAFNIIGVVIEAAAFFLVFVLFLIGISISFIL